MLPRVLEPEVMAAEHEALDYDGMDHSGVNRLFVDDLRTWLPSSSSSESLTIFDAGTGTALIPILLLAAGCPGSIRAADASQEMLRIAQSNVDRARLGHRVELVLRDCKLLPEPSESFDVVMSNSLVHHLATPAPFLAECWRILKPGGTLFLRDLLRPVSNEAVEHLVATYAGHENASSQQLFRQSLHAALTLDELRELLKTIGLPTFGLRQTSDRHWTLATRKEPAAAGTSVTD